MGATFIEMVLDLITDPAFVATILYSAVSKGSVAAVKSGASPAAVADDVVKGAADDVVAANNIANLGDDFGKLGVIIENPNIKVDWPSVSIHGMERMVQRGVTKEMIETWVKNGKVLQQSSGNIVYITKEGVAVLNRTGKLVTTYTSAEFDANMLNVIKQLFGE